MKITGILLYVIMFLNVQPFCQVPSPKVKWKFQTDGTIRAKASIIGEKILFGNSAGNVYCLHKSTGKQIWQYKTGGAITASLGINKNSVIVSSRDNTVYALNLSNGNLLWEFNMGSLLKAENGGWKYFSSAPVIVDDCVYVGSGDGNLYALNLNSGQIKWKFTTKSRIRATPLIVENAIYLPSNDGILYVLDLKTGKHQWSFTTAGASMDARQFSFDRKSIYDQPILHKDRLIFGSRDGNVYSVDVNSGEATWNFAYGTTWAMATSMDEQSVYVGWSTNNLVSALNIETGEERWQFKCGAHIYTEPLLVGDNVYFGSADGYFYRLNKHTGDKIWQYRIGREIYSSPLYGNNTFYLGCDDGYYYALEEAPKLLKTVYHPDTLKGNVQYLVADPGLTPYLLTKGFRRLNQGDLFRFVNDRIADKNPSVIVFTLPLIPKEVIGKNPESGLMRKYLESGGKVVWLGDVPNFYEPDDNGNFKRDVVAGEKLLDVRYEEPRESGNYFATSTATGRQWGLPPWFKSTGSIVSPSKDIIPLAYDEFNRISVWYKKFSSQFGAGFVSCKSWAWNVPSNEQDLEIIHQLATYGLQ